MKSGLEFIDLFAGLGGFHVALSQLGCKCVFASELRKDLQELYKLNFPETPRIEGDITKVDLASIPHHDILCAGFPCQPFSQAGKRQGFQDKGRGNMFDYICGVIEERAKVNDKPSLLLLENVSNLEGHDNGNTWAIIRERLEELGYAVKGKVVSPHQYGYPQHRKRIYIVGILRDSVSQDIISKFAIPVEHKEHLCNIKTIVDENDEDIQTLSLKTHQQLKVWQVFLDYLKEKNRDVPKFPIWAMEFGANYPYKEAAPFTLSVDDLRNTRGKLGHLVEGMSVEECLEQLPVYAQTATSQVFPPWKIRYIAQNREFWNENHTRLKSWRNKIETWDNSHQKLEWNCKENDDYQIKTKIVQFRASGIRVKLPTFSPALNLVGTQVPILPWIKIPEKCVPKYTIEDLETYGLSQEDVKYGRYLTTREAAALQGMESLQFGTLPRTRIYEALGNAVNTQVVKKIADRLIELYGKG